MNIIPYSQLMNQTDRPNQTVLAEKSQERRKRNRIVGEKKVQFTSSPFPAYPPKGPARFAPPAIAQHRNVSSYMDVLG